MEAKEKLVSLKRRAFARFKSHSYEVPSSSPHLSPYCSTNTSDYTTHNSSVVEEKVENLNIQSDLDFLENKLTFPQQG